MKKNLRLFKRVRTRRSDMVFRTLLSYLASRRCRLVDKRRNIVVT